MHRRLFLGSVAATLALPGLTQTLHGQGSTIASSGDEKFDLWLNDFYTRAVAGGLPADVMQRELSPLTPDPRVVSLDSRQPEIARPVSDYIRGTVSAERVSTGQKKREELAWLADVEQTYGVPGEILIAIWALESAFGEIQGDFDVIRSVASLAADGRRRPLFEANLTAAIKMIASGEVTREQMKGSWAGAMGQTQFSCEDYLVTAVDADRDGRRDIWNSSQDALASAANLLKKAGWKPGENWQREVVVPEGFDYSVVEGPRLAPAVWDVQGVRPADGQAWSAADAASQAQLIAPAGAAGPMFLIFPNHFVIRRYNNSTSYALGVGLLAERIAGKPDVVRPWPQEQGLSSADRIGAQTALARLGFDPGVPDGIIGVNTRAAVRAYQKARGLIADGYLTVDLSRRLQAEAAALPPLIPATETPVS